MKDIVIIITTQEQMEMEAILLDKDKEAALAFLKVLKDRIEAVNRKQMRSPLDK